MNISRYAELIKGWSPEMGMIIGNRLNDEYHWLGGPVVEFSQEGFRRLNGLPMNNKGLVAVGPYVLQILSSRTFMGDILAVKMNSRITGDGLLVFKFRFKRWLKSLNRKVLHTLAIWEVLPCDPGAIPEWRNLFRRKKVDDDEEVVEYR